MPTVDFIETPPPKNLTEYFEAFWHCDITKKGMILLLPTASSDLMAYHTSYSSGLVLIGPMTKSQIAHVNPGDVFVGARLRVGSRTVFQTQAHAILHDSKIYGSSIDLQLIHEFEQNIPTLKTHQKIESHLKILAKKLIDEKLISRDPLVDRFIAHEQASSSPVKIEELLKAIPLSQRHFRRRFIQYTGLTPKQFLLLSRQQLAVAELQQKDGTVAALAANHGYTDQAHFSHEFRELIGVSPLALENELTLK